VILFLWLTVVLYSDSGSIGFQCYIFYGCYWLSLWLSVVQFTAASYRFPLYTLRYS